VLQQRLKIQWTKGIGKEMLIKSLIIQCFRRAPKLSPRIPPLEPLDEQCTLKTYRDTSCSPIRIETPPDEPTPRVHSGNSAFFPYSGATSYLPNSSEETTSHRLSSSCPSSSASDEDETPKSSDSLRSYNGPKFGQPGDPGTRDLEFSLRKMQLHKKVGLF
jgi:hypothetical protein